MPIHRGHFFRAPRGKNVHLKKVPLCRRPGRRPRSSCQQIKIMIEVIMPKVDMAMTEGTIALWRFRAGEEVRAGEPLFDITTDKADVEVEAPASGTLWDVRAAAGQTIPIGQPVAFILAPGEQPPEDEGRKTKDEGRKDDGRPTMDDRQ